MRLFFRWGSAFPSLWRQTFGAVSCDVKTLEHSTDKLWIQRTATQTLSEQRGGNKASLSHPSTACPSIIPLCVATTCQCQSVFSSCQPPAMNRTGQWEASLLISWRDLIMWPNPLWGEGRRASGGGRGYTEKNRRIFR